MRLSKSVILGTRAFADFALHIGRWHARFPESIMLDMC